MFTKKKNSIFLIILVLLFAFNARAQEKDDLKEFLSSSEFGLQRKVIKEAAIGQKGLTGAAVEETDIKDVLTVDLIDPFANKAIVGTKTKLENLDDGIEISEDEMIAETINSFRGRVEDYFASIENQTDIDFVELLDNLVISQIISSPNKYIVIQGRKFKENDEIKVAINRFNDDSEFEAMLDSIKVETGNAEEAELLADLKLEAKERYASLTSTAADSLNTIKIKVQEITKHQVSFIIDEKVYKIIMKK